MTTVDTEQDPEQADYPTGYPRLFWVALILGWIVVAIGVRGLLVNADARMPTDPPGWALFLVKPNLAHDFLLVPMVLSIGVVVARVVPARIRAPIQAGLICSGIVALFAYPFVRRYGASTSNPTILPQDHTRGLLIVSAGVWSVTLALVVWKWRSGGKPSSPSVDG